MARAGEATFAESKYKIDPKGNKIKQLSSESTVSRGRICSAIHPYRYTMIQGGINYLSTFCELPNLGWATVSVSLCHLGTTCNVQPTFEALCFTPCGHFSLLEAKIPWSEF